MSSRRIPTQLSPESEPGRFLTLDEYWAEEERKAAEQLRREHSPMFSDGLLQRIFDPTCHFNRIYWVFDYSLYVRDKIQECRRLQVEKASWANQAWENVFAVELQLLDCRTPLIKRTAPHRLTKKTLTLLNRLDQLKEDLFWSVRFLPSEHEAEIQSPQPRKRRTAAVDCTAKSDWSERWARAWEDLRTEVKALETHAGERTDTAGPVYVTSKHISMAVGKTVPVIRALLNADDAPRPANPPGSNCVGTWVWESVRDYFRRIRPNWSVPDTPLPSAFANGLLGERGTSVP